MQMLLNDARFCMRLLSRHPSLAVMALAVLALSIGCNVVIFGVLQAVLLRPLPYAGADRIVQIWSTFPRRGLLELSNSSADIQDIRARSHTFEHIAMYKFWRANVVSAGHSRPFGAGRVSVDFFPLLGVTPIIGRGFVTADDKSAASPVAVVSESMWRQEFGANRNILGQAVAIDNKLFTVIGVVPSRLALIGPADVWVPFLITEVSP